MFFNCIKADERAAFKGTGQGRKFSEDWQSIPTNIFLLKCYGGFLGAGDVDSVTSFLTPWGKKMGGFAHLVLAGAM